jgi:glycosyltransferase involved in cell wall biosynthesis
MAIITVSIPTYNRAAFLRESIPSILNQTFADLVVLVCDNASTDDTKAVVASFNDSRVIYHRNSTNIGLALNTRAALTLAKTEYVALLSDDDLYRPNHLSTAFEGLQRYPQAAFYTCASEIFGNGQTGQLRPQSVTDTQTRFQYFAPQQALQFLGRETPGPFMTIVCRRDALTEDVVWGDESFVPTDLLAMTQIMLRGGFVFGNEPTVRYRLHGANAATGSRRLKRLRLTCMEHYAVGYNARLLLGRGLCSLDDIRAHGLRATSQNHVVALAIGLSLPENPPELRRIAADIFKGRKDMDRLSSRFRLARGLGFWSLPALEVIGRKLVGWQPRTTLQASYRPSP